MSLFKEHKKFNKIFDNYKTDKISEKKFKNKVKQMSMRLFYAGICEAVQQIKKDLTLF